MKKLILLAAACAGSLFAAGSVQQNASPIGNSGVFLISMYWTGDAVTGTVPVTNAVMPPGGLAQGYRIVNAEMAPGSVVPTAGYGVALTDSLGLDFLGGQALTLSNTIPQSFFGLNPLPLVGTFSLTISGQATPGAKGTVLVYVAPVSNTIALPLSATLLQSGQLLPGYYLFAAGQNGAKCDDIAANANPTDDTNAMLALLTRVSSAGGGVIFVGGTCLISSAELLIPYVGTNSPTQASFRITGAGPSMNANTTGLPVSPSQLDLRFNAPVAKIDTRGIGYLEIDHLNLIDGGSDCAPFVQTTNTNLHLHDVGFSGTHSGTASCNDIALLGGTAATGDTDNSNAFFQGYGTVIRDNFFVRVKSLRCRAGCNGIPIVNNTWWNSTGSNDTTAISSATNANPAVLTLNDTFGAGPDLNLHLTISGFTGNWGPANGAHICVLVTTSTCALTGINSTGFGAVTGTPVWLSGTAIELKSYNPGTFADSGNFISGNLIETINYPFVFDLAENNINTITGNSLFDSSGTTIAFARFAADSGLNYYATSWNNSFNAPYFDRTGAFGQICGTNTIVTPAQTQANCYPQPEVHTSVVDYVNPGGTFPIGCDSTGTHCWYQSITTSGQDVLRQFLCTGGKIGLTGYVGGSCGEKINISDFGGGVIEMICSGGTTDCRLISAGDLRLYAASGGTIFIGDGAKNMSYNSSTGLLTVPSGGSVTTPGFTFNGHTCSLVSTVMTCP